MARLSYVIIGLGIFLGIYGFREMKLASGSSGQPQQITCYELETVGVGENKFVDVCDFFLADFAYVYAQREGSAEYESVFVPLVSIGSDWYEEFYALLDEYGNLTTEPPPLRDVKVILKTEEVKRQHDLHRIANLTTIRGMIINDIESLDGEELRLLQGAFPQVSMRDCYVLEQGREPKGSGAIYASLGGGALLVLLGLGGVVGSFRRG